MLSIMTIRSNCSSFSFVYTFVTSPVNYQNFFPKIIAKYAEIHPTTDHIMRKLNITNGYVCHRSFEMISTKYENWEWTKITHPNKKRISCAVSTTRFGSCIFSTGFDTQVHTHPLMPTHTNARIVENNKFHSHTYHSWLKLHKLNSV